MTCENCITLGSGSGNGSGSDWMFIEMTFFFAFAFVYAVQLSLATNIALCSDLKDQQFVLLDKQHECVFVFVFVYVLSRIPCV